MKSNVKRLMDDKSYTVSKVAERANLSQDVIWKAKNHIEFCTIRSLQKIANVLGCKVKDLFEED